MSGNVSEAQHARAHSGLDVRELEVRRAGRTIVDRVSFTLEPGEIVAVIGANGAGKTTLLEAVVGAIQTHVGSVHFRGKALARLAARARVFSYMPDAAEPPAEVAVAVLLHYAQRCGGIAVDRAERLAERLGLRALAAARAGELSRGEKRRVSLFGALCSARPVIVLDEPLGAFDPMQLLDVLDVLRESARGGAGLLLSVHQLTDAEKIATRILILQQGRIVGSGSLDQLRARVGRAQASLEEIFLRILDTKC